MSIIFGFLINTHYAYDSRAYNIIKHIDARKLNDMCVCSKIILSKIKTWPLSVNMLTCALVLAEFIRFKQYSITVVLFFRSK
jgi:hypothetical protein